VLNNFIKPPIFLIYLSWENPAPIFATSTAQIPTERHYMMYRMASQPTWTKSTSDEKKVKPKQRKNLTSLPKRFWIK